MTANEIREKLSSDVLELSDRDTYAVAALVNELLEPPLTREEIEACEKVQQDVASGNFSDYMTFEDFEKELDLLNDLENNNRKTTSKIHFKAVS